VVVADIDAAGASQVAAEIAAQGGRALGQRTDVSDPDSVAAMVAAAVDVFGGLDILHNNAALTDAAVIGSDGELADLDLSVWERTLAVNLRGPMLGCRVAIPRMLERGGGSIVNTSSVSGLTGDTARVAYGVSKAGVDSLTRYVATQYGKRGIRCNSIAPGVISTPALERNVPPELIAIFEQSHLTPRLGSPEDIAALVVFLASDAAGFITGQVLCVDGGLMAHHPTFASVRARSGA
jgi:NAD(P)-dependent dehydrogenase (short-subunit alcohol dehydrogenase family)